MKGSSLLEVLIALALFSSVALGIGEFSLCNLRMTFEALKQTREIIHNASF